ncbi:phosphotransferase enzyme family protein [Oceanirhabdus sp. W0125-5]|uniref:phosphotransferase enzyme family protein n=1 Tax=Oceanirhabdus sp. W0125-5 TaxID=2999116 RepID=UPI0022F2CF0B|nr:phosphotransferase [Oceanirhabdus sp. W0125-5]WBW96593.1 phosphotransferase [Oceanirhabdus sp. W0125-5]
MGNELNKKIVDMMKSQFNLEGKLEQLEGESIYKYSPVFICMYDGKKAVIKKTKENKDKAMELLNWEEELRNNGVECVSPIKDSNGKFITCIVQEKRWVLYPYIDGNRFDGSINHIRNAGKLLGKMHKVGLNKRFFSGGFKFEAFDEEFLEEVNDDLKSIKERYKSIINNDVLDKFEKWIRDTINSNYNNIQERELPMVDCSWDYKGNNLVYSEEGIPTLIDPDNGGYVPRIIDLALALILFNNEIETAPPRIFNKEEWNAFKEGYYEYIELNQVEKDSWNDILRFVFIDEGLWAIVDLEDDESERQKEFIKSLIGFNVENFIL